MLSVHHLSKSYGIEPILKDITFSLKARERLALVGPNGCGKTTLLRILAGEEAADAGSVQFTPSSLRWGYLPQGFAPDDDETLGSFLSLGEDQVERLSIELERLAAELAGDSARPEAQAAYDRVLARLERSAEDVGRGPAVLAALGLGDFPLDTPVRHLSGGQKTRLALAGLLLEAPQLLLLDEPTNHLDLDMLSWLEDWLAAYDGAALIVSHDRAFLDQVATGILEIDPATRGMRQYAGNYTAYLEAKLAERDREWQAYSDQQAEISRLRATAAHIRSQAKYRVGGKTDGGDKFAKGFFANRALETMRRAKHIEKRLERLLTEEHIEKPKESWQMKLDFSDGPASVPTGGRDALVLEDLAVGYNGQALLTGIDAWVRQGRRIALVGPNGCGKTTLLRTIAGVLPPVAGRVRLGTNVRVGYMAQEQENLKPEWDAFTTIRSQASFSETEARTFLHRFLFSGDEVFLPVANLSYGERARLSLACLVAQGCNLLLLDEPINHLDIPSRTRFEQALNGFDGTALAVVHDRYFIDGFASEVWEVRDGSLTKYDRGDL